MQKDTQTLTLWSALIPDGTAWFVWGLYNTKIWSHKCTLCKKTWATTTCNAFIQYSGLLKLFPLYVTLWYRHLKICENKQRIFSKMSNLKHRISGFLWWHSSNEVNIELSVDLAMWGHCDSRLWKSIELNKYYKLTLPKKVNLYHLSDESRYPKKWWEAIVSTNNVHSISKVDDVSKKKLSYTGGITFLLSSSSIVNCSSKTSEKKNGQC